LSWLAHTANFVFPQPDWHGPVTPYQVHRFFCFLKDTA